MIKKILLGILMLGMTAIAVIFVWNSFQKNIYVQVAETPWATSAQTAPSLAKIPKIKQTEGTITIVEFIDYSCPYCRQFFPILRTATAGNPHVNIMIRPVGLLSEDSLLIAGIITAAAEQNKAMELHDSVMSTPEFITPDQVYEHAKTLGLDIVKLRVEADSKKTADTIKMNKALHKKLGLAVIPSLLINGNRYAPLDGMPTADELKTIISHSK